MTTIEPNSGGLLNVNVSDIFGACKLADQIGPVASEILSKVGSGLGLIAEPARLYLTQRAESRAASKNAIERAETQRRVAEIEQETAALMSRAGSRLVAQEVRRQKNIEAVTSEAIDLSAGRGASRSIDEDWLADWMTGAADASASELRTMWAKLIAEAASEAGSEISQATLQVLKSFDAKLAREFDRLCRYTLAIGAIISPAGLRWANLEEIPDLHINTILISELRLKKIYKMMLYSISEGYIYSSTDGDSVLDIEQMFPSERGIQIRRALYTGASAFSRKSADLGLVSMENQVFVLKQVLLHYLWDRRPCYIMLIDEASRATLLPGERAADYVLSFDQEAPSLSKLAESKEVLSPRLMVAIEQALAISREDLEANY